MHSSIRKKLANRLVALLCACAFGLAAAGCHNDNQDSGFGVAWTTLTTTDDAGQFTSYLVTIDSVVMVGALNGEVGAIEVPETVDFTKLTNLSELWATASLPVDTYSQAIITLDYTSAQISVLVNGAPVKVNVVDPTGAAVTTVAVTVNLDPQGGLVLQPTFATSNALRLAFNFDMTASNKVNMTTSPPTVTVEPYMSVATTAADSKLIRVRGPLINSSTSLSTYTVVVRPFFDEVNSLGIDTIFNDANTIYTYGGLTYVGAPGITALSQASAGSTITAAFCTFEPTPTPQAGVIAGIFHSVYVVAGSTLEDFFTEGLEGDVIARSGNTLTIRGGTLDANAAEVIQYEDLDSQVLLGPATQVTADGVSTFGTLNSNSIAVGQHITARGLYSVNAAGVTVLDSTGSSVDTGSVRLQSTELFGTLNSTASGSLQLNVQNIENYPVSVYNFAGNGVSAAQDPVAANFTVNTGALTLPAAAPGDPLWVDGYVAPFGTAPPAFTAFSVNAEPAVPATLAVVWTGTGTAAPFATLTPTGLTIDLTNAAFGSGQLRIGADTINLTTLSATPNIVPAVAVPAATTGLPLFNPRFSVGAAANPDVATNTPITSFITFAAFVTQLNTTFATPTPATQFVARGMYDNTSNTFTASSIDVVL
ncbi:MAG TPA: hypothetical protein VNW05_09130 [Steroidobacteraceae bacterium]|nr:hypothetical protein [Steroidobacteraceae bacterium]